MALTAYDTYVRHLHEIIEHKRAAPNACGRIQITISQNAASYRSVETFGPTASKECWTGSVLADRWTRDEDGASKAEIERFFALPVFFAYSDQALHQPQLPIHKAHWDATVALIDATLERDGETLQQRMMFAGFSDPIHAEFFTATEGSVLVHDHETGEQLFEWRSVAGQGPVPALETDQQPSVERRALSQPARRSWISSRVSQLFRGQHASLG